jgi:hypothetical protein
MLPSVCPGGTDHRGPAAQVDQVPAGQFLIDPARRRRALRLAHPGHDPLVQDLLLGGELGRRAGHLTPDDRGVGAVGQDAGAAARGQVGGRPHVILVKVGEDDLPQAGRAQSQVADRGHDTVALPGRAAVDQGQ